MKAKLSRRATAQETRWPHAGTGTVDRLREVGNSSMADKTSGISVHPINFCVKPTWPLMLARSKNGEQLMKLALVGVATLGALLINQKRDAEKTKAMQSSATKACKKGCVHWLINGALRYRCRDGQTLRNKVRRFSRRWGRRASRLINRWRGGGRGKRVRGTQEEKRHTGTRQRKGINVGAERRGRKGAARRGEPYGTHPKGEDTEDTRQRVKAVGNERTRP